MRMLQMGLLVYPQAIIGEGIATIETAVCKVDN
jgi:hypothetical protein